MGQVDCCVTCRSCDGRIGFQHWKRLLHFAANCPKPGFLLSLCHPSRQAKQHSAVKMSVCRSTEEKRMSEWGVLDLAPMRWERERISNLMSIKSGFKPVTLLQLCNEFGASVILRRNLHDVHSHCYHTYNNKT